MTPRERVRHYPALALAALQGEAFGSSAGGEQPKFTVTLREGASSSWRSCIVKFSDRTTTPAGRRWADLLRSEAIAAQVLREHGIDASICEIVEAEGRVFLEATRFDRTPALGRRGLVSLRALDAAFHGHGAIDWWRYAPQLAREGWIVDEDARRLQVLGLFGALIGNADMHLGNASLVLRDERPLALAPAYDMLPMRWAPNTGGEVVPRVFEVLLPPPAFAQPWRHAAHAAVDFWQRVHREPAISGAFKAIASDAGGKVAAALQRLG
jgi:serine/threonine protein kinase HipA of HipAB toxin-antitoxin module